MIKRKAELEAERSRVERESEDMGAMWGMGKLLTASLSK